MIGHLSPLIDAPCLEKGRHGLLIERLVRILRQDQEIDSV